MRPKLTDREIRQKTEMGIKLRKLRAARKWTQKDLANIVDLTPRAIQQLENGILFPTIQRAVRLANAFDVSLEFLIGEFD